MISFVPMPRVETPRSDDPENLKKHLSKITVLLHFLRPNTKIEAELFTENASCEDTSFDL